MVEPYTCLSDLWSQLCAVGFTRDDVGPALQAAEAQLTQGVLFYQKWRATTPEVPGEQAEDLSDLVAGKLGDVIDLVARSANVKRRLAATLIEEFLINEYRGSILNADIHLRYAISKRRFVEDVTAFLIREKLFSLVCLKLVLLYGRRDKNGKPHPYASLFHDFSRRLASSPRPLEGLVEQSRALYSENPPGPETGLPLPERVLREWRNYRATGQLLLAQIVLLVATECRQLQAESVLGLLELGVEQRFGHALDVRTPSSSESCELTEAVQITTLAHLLLQAPGLEGGMGLLEKLHARLQETDARGLPGVLYLALYLARFHPKAEPDAPVWAELAETAWLADRIDLLRHLLEAINKLEDPLVTNQLFGKLKVLFELTVRHFPEQSLGNPAVYEVHRLLLENSACCREEVRLGGESGGEMEGLRGDILDYFPLAKIPLFRLVTAYAKANEAGLKRILDEVRELDLYTEALSDVPPGSLRVMDGVQCTSLVRRSVAQGAVTLPEGAAGTLTNLQSTLPQVHWQIRYSFWAVLEAELRQLAHQVERQLEVNWELATAAVCCVESVLQASWDHNSEFSGAVRQALVLTEMSCKASPLPHALLASGVRVLSRVAVVEPIHTCEMAMGAGLAPCLSPLHTDCSVEMGVLEGLCQQHEWTPASADLLLAVLELLNSVHKLPGVPERLVHGGILTVSEGILPHLTSWRFKGCGELLYKAGLLGLKFLHAVLNPSEPSPLATARLELCVRSLVRERAAPMLLKLAVLGEETLRSRLLCQSSVLHGPGSDLLHLVIMDLAVLNAVMLRRRELHPKGESCHLVRLLEVESRLQHDGNLFSQLLDYLYFKFHPNLPTMALKVVTNVFQDIPHSLSAYLSTSATAMRDTFEFRVMARDDYPPLRTTILDLITLCITRETHTALVEVLLLGGGHPQHMSPILEYLMSLLQAANKRPEQMLTSPVYQAMVRLLHASWAAPEGFITRQIKQHKDFWTLFFSALHSQHTGQNDCVAQQLLYILYRELRSAEVKLPEEGDLPPFHQQLKDFLKNHTQGWTKYLVSSVMACLPSEEGDGSEQTPDSTGKERSREARLESLLPLLQHFSAVIVAILRCKRVLVEPTEQPQSLVREFLGALLGVLGAQQEGPLVGEVARLLVCPVQECRSMELGTSSELTLEVQDLVWALSVRYPYLDPATRAITLNIVYHTLSWTHLDLKQACAGRSPLVQALKVLLQEDGKLPRVSSNTLSSTTLHCCLLRLLERADREELDPEGLEQLKDNLVWRQVLMFATELLGAEREAGSAQVALRLLVTVSKHPTLRDCLLWPELDSLLMELAHCRDSQSLQHEVRWEGVYGQGLLLCTSLVRHAPREGLPYALRFLHHNALYVRALLGSMLNRQDSRNTVLILRLCRLLNLLADRKVLWRCHYQASYTELLSPLLVCLDLCILQLTRPNLQLLRQLPLPPDPAPAFTCYQEKPDLLLQVAGEIMQALQRLSTPEHASLRPLPPHTVHYTPLVSPAVTPVPSLVTSYRPEVSIAHLISLCHMCVDDIALKCRARSATPTKESPAPYVRSDPELAFQTLSTCLDFTLQQAQAHLHGLPHRDPAAATFRADVHRAMRFVLEDLGRHMERQQRHQRPAATAGTTEGDDWPSPLDRTDPEESGWELLD